MRQDEQVSRFEVNRKVRVVIARHDGDLTRIDYSFMGRTVYLSGELTKPDREYSAREIESIAADILAIPEVIDVIFDLNNWIVESSGDSSWHAKPIRQTGRLIYASGSGTEEAPTHVIQQPDELRDIIHEIRNTNVDLKKED